MPKLISASTQRVLYVATWKLAHTWGGHAFVMLSKCQHCYLRLLSDLEPERERQGVGVGGIMGIGKTGS